MTIVVATSSALAMMWNDSTVRVVDSQPAVTDTDDLEHVERIDQVLEESIGQVISDEVVS